MSSAYKHKLVFSESFGFAISFMNKQQISGPRIDPCGTPDLTAWQITTSCAIYYETLFTLC